MSSVDDAVAQLFPQDLPVNSDASSRAVRPSFASLLSSPAADSPALFADMDDDPDVGALLNEWTQSPSPYDQSPDAQQPPRHQPPSQVLDIGTTIKTPGMKPKRKPVQWTIEEHQLFLQGMARYRTVSDEAIGRNGEVSVGLGAGIAELISMMVGTRSAAQVRSHAQKHFQRLRKEAGGGKATP